MRFLQRGNSPLHGLSQAVPLSPNPSATSSEPLPHRHRSGSLAQPAQPARMAATGIPPPPCRWRHCRVLARRGAVPLSAGLHSGRQGGWRRIPAAALLWNGGSRLLSISRGAAPPLSEVDLRLWRWEMGRRWLSRADLALPLAGVMCGERWRRSLGDARRASTAWAPAVGRIASSSRRSTLRGGCSVSRDGGEAHLGGVRCGPAGSTAVVCVTLASPALPRRRFGTCSRSGGSWMA
jgi:hypothetical protein